MPRTRQHVFDLVADDLANYIEQAAQELADALTEDGVAPFAAPLDRPQQEAYYVAKYGEYVFNPDGSPNERGREHLLNAFGADAFAEIVRVVLRDRQRQRVRSGTPTYAYPVFAQGGSPAAPEATPTPAAPSEGGGYGSV